MTTEERLEKLERELVGMKGVIHTCEVALEDEGGAIHAKLAVDGDDTVLALFDKNRKAHAQLTLQKAGSSLALIDENSQLRAVLSMTKDGSALELRDERGKTIWKAP